MSFFKIEGFYSGFMWFSEGVALQIDEGAQWVAEVVVVAHIDGHLTDGDRALDADRDVVGIVGDPNGHLFTAFEHGAFYEQRFELDGAELAVAGADGFLTEVADIEMIDLSVEEHIEWDLVIHLVLAEVDVSGIEDGAEHILDAIGDGIHSGVGDGGVGGLYKGDVFVGLVTAFVDVAEEFVGLKRGGVDIGLVFIPHLEELIIERVGLSFADEMIDVLSLELFERGGEGGFAAAGEVNARHSIVDPVFENFAGLERVVADAVTEFAAGLWLFGLRSLRGQR